MLHHVTLIPFRHDHLITHLNIPYYKRTLQLPLYNFVSKCSKCFARGMVTFDHPVKVFLT